MISILELPQTLTLTLALIPTQGTREPSGMGDAERSLGKVCVDRAQIDAQTPIVDENTFWTSWVLLPLSLPLEASLPSLGDNFVWLTHLLQLLLTVTVSLTQRISPTKPSAG